MTSGTSLIDVSGSSRFGSGYGMMADLALSSTLWTLLQVVLFQWPDLSAYKMKRVPYLDLRNRMVSFIHGLLCIVTCAYALLKEGSECG